MIPAYTQVRTAVESADYYFTSRLAAADGRDCIALGRLDLEVEDIETWLPRILFWLAKRDRGWYVCARDRMYRIPREEDVPGLCVELLDNAGDTEAPDIDEATETRYHLVPVALEGWCEQTYEAIRKERGRLESEGKYNDLERAIQQAGFHTLLDPRDGLMCGTSPNTKGKGIRGIYITVWIRDDGCYVSSFCETFRVPDEHRIVDVCIGQLTCMAQRLTGDTFAVEVIAKYELAELDDPTFLWYPT